MRRKYIFTIIIGVCILGSIYIITNKEIFNFNANQALSATNNKLNEIRSDSPLNTSNVSVKPEASIKYNLTDLEQAEKKRRDEYKGMSATEFVPNISEIHMSIDEFNFEVIYANAYTKHFSGEKKSNSQIYEESIKKLLMQQYAKQTNIIFNDEQLQKYISEVTKSDLDQIIKDFFNELYKANNMTESEYWKNPIILKRTIVNQMLSKLEAQQTNDTYKKLEKEIFELNRYKIAPNDKIPL